uniref:EamA domain-containing protein n=1 Tax=viral metagenome TaxID=1070528 RepID=A0A6C0KYR4_9ZZZZ
MIWILLLIAALLGILLFIIKLGLTHISPATFMLGFGVSYFIFEIIYSSFHYNNLKKDFSTLHKNKFIFGFFILSGFILSIINLLLFDIIKNNKIYYITATLSIYPIITAFLSYLFLKEQINIYSFIGILFIIFGIIIINFSETIKK